MDRAVAIDVSHFSKSYGSHQAVADISFQVYQGEIFGLLGPNGAGKSTTLRTLITLLAPSSGTATILGRDIVRDADAVRGLIGYVPQERAIDRFLTGREHLELLGALYHLPKDVANQRIAELLKLVETYEPADAADLLARVPQWEILLRHEISVASSPKPFFNERVQELHGGGRDQRGRSAVAPKQAELDFLTRLKTILSQPAPAPIA